MRHNFLDFETFDPEEYEHYEVNCLLVDGVSFLITSTNARMTPREYTPASIYLLFKVNNRNTRKTCEICLKLTITLEQVNTRSTFTVVDLNK